MKILSNILNFSVKAFSFIVVAALRLLMFAVTISFALVKFVISIVLVILSVGAFSSYTSKY